MKKAFAVISLLFLLILIPRIIFFDLDHGDEFSDACALTAGENFLKFGFIKCRLLPSFEYSTDEPKVFYTHYPPLMEVFNGFLRTVFRIDSLLYFRIISIILSLIGILCWYLFIRSFIASPILAYLATLFYLTNPFFIYGADSLHYHCYSEVIRFLFFLVFILFLNSAGAKKRITLLCLWIINFINALITLEYIIYLPLYILFFRYFFADFKEKISLRVIFLIISAAVSGFLLHFLQNSWHFGSFSLAFQDLKDIFLERTVGSYELTQGLNFLVWFKYVILRNFSLVFYFDTVVVLLSIFFAFLLYSKLSDKSREQIKKLFCLFIIFIVCGINWYVFFPSHSLAHAFVNFLARHMVPASAIGFTIFTYIIYSFLKENNLWNNIYLRTSWMAIVSFIILTGILKSELPITLNKIERAQDFKVFTRYLCKLREISDEKNDIGVNYHMFPFIRYYTHRNCNAIFNKDSLEKLPALADYFIFIPYDDQKSQELFKFLQEKYVPLWQCDSLRFPSIFFKLKDT